MPKITCPECLNKFFVNFPPGEATGEYVFEGGSLIVCPTCGNKFKYSKELDAAEDPKIVWLWNIVLFPLATAVIMSVYIYADMEVEKIESPSMYFQQLSGFIITVFLSSSITSLCVSFLRPGLQISNYLTNLVVWLLSGGLLVTLLFIVFGSFIPAEYMPKVITQGLSIALDKRDFPLYIFVLSVVQWGSIDFFLRLSEPKSSLEHNKASLENADGVSKI